MKKKLISKNVISVFFTVILIITMTFSINNAKASKLDTGKWIAVYNGGDTPTHWVCVYSWYCSYCIEGDTRTSDPSAPSTN